MPELENFTKRVTYQNMSFLGITNITKNLYFSILNNIKMIKEIVAAINF